MTTESSIPASIDYLIAKANAAVAAVGSNTSVSDGWPTDLKLSMIGIGIDRPPEAPSGSQGSGTDALLTLGHPQMQERYAIPCYIYDASGGKSQKKCRDAAFALWNAFVGLLRADLNAGTIPVLIMNIADISLEGPKSAEEADEGRYALISFTVACNQVF